jgi:hypothetical protein
MTILNRSDEVRMRATIRFSRVTLVLASLATLACADDKPARIPTEPVGVGANELSAYVSVSNPAAMVRDEVTVSVRALRGSAVGPIGSFTVRLSYDSAGLKFLQAAQSTTGMVMTNTRVAGAIVAAGASSGGFTDDQLVTVKFLVMTPKALQSLALKVTELNGSGFEDRRSQMRVERQLYQAR